MCRNKRQSMSKDDFKEVDADEFFVEQHKPEGRESLTVRSHCRFFRLKADLVTCVRTQGTQNARRMTMVTTVGYVQQNNANIGAIALRCS